MAFDPARIHLFDRDMEPVREIAPPELISAVMTEEINGEHELVVTTTRRLEEGWRALTLDATGKWREWVVTETPQEHSSGAHAIGTYRFVWSLQYDLTNSYFHDTGEAVSIGMGSDTPISTAAQHVVNAAHGWTVGSCDAPDIAAGTGCVFVRESSWSKLSKLVECGGFEVDADIDVDRVHAGISGSDQYRVRGRDLILTSHVGSETATRRFDWGHDIASIKRTPDPGPYYCRVVPLGKGEQEYADDDETTFDYPIDITEEVDEHGDPYPYYLQDDEAAAVFRIRSSYDGSWIYPTIAVSYSEDDPELLLKAAQEDLHKYTRPNVTYEADVLQFSQAGMDVRGVALGDEVQIVDHGFNPDAALRLQGRVTKIEVDLLSPETGTKLTIGRLHDNMADALADVAATFDTLSLRNDEIRKSLDNMNTARYVKELIGRLNTEIAATGGYTYLVEGEGLVTYDKAVVDPTSNLAADGTYATRVIQLKGGYLRIAEDANAGRMGIDDWNFTTILDAGHIVSDLITAVKITSGYIGDATSNNYWNLDTGELVLRLFYNMASGAAGLKTGPSVITRHGYVNTTTATDFFALTGMTINSNTTRYVPGLKISNNNQNYDVNPTSGEESFIAFFPYGGDDNSANHRGWDTIVGKSKLRIWGGWGFYGGTDGRSCLTLAKNEAALTINNSLINNDTGYNDSYPQIRIKEADILLRPHSSVTGDINTYGGSNSTYYRLVGGDGHYLYGDVYLDKDLHIGTTFDIGDAIEISNTSSNRSLNVKDGQSASTGVVSGKLSAGAITARSSVTTVNLYATGNVSSGIKSRVIDTEDYGDRLLYCYETATPTFGDIGSGTIGDDGLCYVMLDDVFAETARTDHAYQVFLQKCGPGDLWVREKRQTHFVVEGTPGLGFDWEAKAHQVGLENLRLDVLGDYVEQSDGPRETATMAELMEEAASPQGEYDELSSAIEDAYTDYAAEMEEIYDQEIAA